MSKRSMLHAKNLSATVLGLVLVLIGIEREAMAVEGMNAEKIATKKILFLGDSITYGGHYVELFELAIRSRFPEKKNTILNLGLSSETVSGLSEDGHAGGRFPRPDLFERLDRVLNQVRPEVVFTCYGMNCGIYKPLSSNNLVTYMERYKKLVETVKRVGAEIVIVTPPAFDPLPIINRTSKNGIGGPFSGYDSVLQTFSLALENEFQSDQLVININTPMTQYVLQKRISDPSYSLARDGVHMNALGHTITFEQILDKLGLAEIDGPPIVLPKNNAIPENYLKYFDNKYNSGPIATRSERNNQLNDKIFKLIKEKQRILKDAWLTKTGHKRPGVRKLEPFHQWITKANAIENSIRELLPE